MSPRRWTIATGATALCGLVASCAAFGTAGNDTPPSITSDAGDAGPASEGGRTPSDADASTCAADVKNDNKNCGRCAHSCLEGVCSDGVCKPIVLKSDLQSAHYLRAQGPHLFVASDVRVHRIDKVSGDELTVLTRSKAIRDLVVVGPRVFCSNDDGIEGAGIDATNQLKVTGAKTWGLGTDGVRIYGCERGAGKNVRIYEANVESNGFVVSEEADACESVGTAKDLVFYGGSKLSVVKSDGTEKTNPSGSAPPARRIVLDANFVYSIATDSAAVTRRPVDAVATAITVSTSLHAIEDGDIAVDATHVYWTDGRLDGGIFRAPKTGGQREKLAAGTHPKGIAVDEAAVYWTEPAGVVMKLAK